MIVGKTFEEQIRNLQDVFKRLQRANFRLYLKKCQVFKRKVLRCQLKGNSRETGESYPDIASTGRQASVKSFLGLCTYYRRFLVCKLLRLLSIVNLLPGLPARSIWDTCCRKGSLSWTHTPGTWDLKVYCNGSEKVIGYFLSKPEQTTALPEMSYWP